MPVWSVWGEFGMTTADGLMAFRDTVNQTDHESNKISERTKRGKQRKAERGRSNASWRSFPMPGWAPRPE